MDAQAVLGTPKLRECLRIGEFGLPELEDIGPNPLEVGEKEGRQETSASYRRRPYKGVASQLGAHQRDERQLQHMH